MLRYFHAALSKLSRARPFDVLAETAELSLDAAAVAIVDPNPRPRLIGKGNHALPPGLVDRACAVPSVDPGALRVSGPPLPGTPLPFPPPFARVVNLPMVCGLRPVQCLVFPVLPGVEPRRILRFVNVGRQHLAEVALTQRYRADLRRYITMFEHMERTAHIGVWELDVETEELFWSDEVFRIHERPIGRTPTLAEALDHYVEPGRTLLADAMRALHASGAPCDLTLDLVTCAGNRRVVRVIASLQRTSDGSERIAGVFQDVTQQEEANERLWWNANHDALTGLPNRALFSDRFRQALERCRRTGARACLVLVDVDDFKEVNDTLGHAAGDELLCIVARTLRDNVRTSDTVARSGGDEFSILLEDVGDPAVLDGIFARIRAALDVRLVWKERTMRVTMSGGAALAPDHGGTERELTGAADLALYRMKESRDGQLALYDPVIASAAEARARLLAEARQALAEGRFVPWYQPQVDIASGAVVAVEALARWIADDGVREAKAFATALEDHEVGAMIGRAVVDRAIADIARLNAGRCRKVALSVNASEGELLRASFLERIGRLRGDDGGEAGPITVEINEDVILDDVGGRVEGFMREAAQRGVGFSLDDFGRSGASLLEVSTLPISEVKVDRSVVAGLVGDEERQRIIRGMIEAARTLGLRLIIEGVETAEELRCITALGGRIAQGFYYSRAVPIEALPALIDRAEQNIGDAA
jgi:diguanylate cyclase (GGDEF)-like protein